MARRFLLSDFAVKPTDTFAFKYAEKASTRGAETNHLRRSPEVKRSAETFIDRLECIPAFVANHTLEAFQQQRRHGVDLILARGSKTVATAVKPPTQRPPRVTVRRSTRADMFALSSIPTATRVSSARRASRLVRARAP